MVRSFALASLLAAASASALAIDRRNNDGGGDSSGGDSGSSSGTLDDPAILNFALTLEHLESAFYSQGLANYSEQAFSDAGFDGIRMHIEEIAADEAQHVEFITSALSAAGASPVGESTYVWPSTDVKSFLGLSQILEGVGVAAYLGAAPAISSKEYLSAAGSILTVEARHNAFIRYANGQSPFPGPEDAALSPRSVVTLAAAFFAPGAQNAPSIMPFPAITVSGAANPNPGDTVTVTPGEGVSLEGSISCAFVSGLLIGFSEYDAQATSCQIPTSNVTAGQTYVLLTSSQSLSDDSTLAGPAIIDVGDAPMGMSASQGGGSANEAGGSDSEGGESASQNGDSSGASALLPSLLLLAGLAVL